MESERRIEKLLRAYAKKRRDQAGAPSGLHPATRRLLHDEIARRAPKLAGDDPAPSLFARFWHGLVFATGAAAIVLIVVSLILPALSSAKLRAKSSLATSNLRQIGQAVQEFASQNNRVPASLDEIKPRLDTEKTLVDPESGERFVYVGGENRPGTPPSAAIVAYSPTDNRGRLVLFMDGHVERMAGDRLAQLSRHGAVDVASTSADQSGQPVPLLASNKEKAPAESTVPAVSNEDALRESRREIAAKDGERKPETPAAAPITVARTEARWGDTGGTVVLTNAEQLVAGNASPSVETGAANQPAAEVAQSGTTAGYDMARSASPPPSFDESKADGKLNLKQNGGEFSNGAVASVASQNYSQLESLADAQYRDKKIAAPVLASFQLQQADQNIRVVDQDGSVYNGYWRLDDVSAQHQQATSKAMPSTPPGSAAVVEEGVRADKDRQQSGQNFFFQVTGTNRSLNQNVVFTGNFTALTKGAPMLQKNSLLGGGGGKAMVNDLQNQAGNQSLQLLLSNSRISGTAIINNNRQIEINALPVIAPR